MFLPDKFAKTVIIPTKYLDGELINQLTGEKLSGIDNDAFIELSLNKGRVLDPFLVEALDDESEVEFLPQDSSLYANISEKSIPASLMESTMTPANLFRASNGKFVPFRLLNPLIIEMRGTKMPRLLPCRCEIASIKKQADSINHAYSLISTEFEPHRMTHTGNVFDKVFCTLRDAGEEYVDVCAPLDELRTLKNVHYYEELKKRYQDKINGT